MLQSLEDDLKSALRSDLEDISLALLKTPAQFDAYLIRKATKVNIDGFNAKTNVTVDLTLLFMASSCQQDPALIGPVQGLYWTLLIYSFIYRGLHYCILSLFWNKAPNLCKWSTWNDNPWTPIWLVTLFLQGLGTSEDVLVEVLATRSNQEIHELKTVFKEGLCTLFIGPHALRSWKVRGSKSRSRAKTWSIWQIASTGVFVPVSCRLFLSL